MMPPLLSRARALPAARTAAAVLPDAPRDDLFSTSTR
jgi:hypothetical protein